MCVIIYAPKGKKISKNELKEAYDYNDDGCGMAWIEGGKVHYSKGYTNFEVFYNCMETKITNTTIDRVFHFRITSRGTTNCYQTHPFLASDDKKDMELLDYTGTTPVLFMNGTITKQKLYNGLNDTASYIIDNLSDNKINLSSKSTIKKIDKETGSKWAIVETSGVTLVGTFEEEDGLYFSNTYHKWSYWTNYSYNKSTKSYTKTVKDYYGEDYFDESEWYADIIESSFGYDALSIYYDALYYDMLEPAEALKVVVNYVKDEFDNEYNLSENFDDYEVNYDKCTFEECTYDDYEVASLFSEYEDYRDYLYAEEELDDDEDFEYPESLSDLFPRRETDVGNDSALKDWIDCTILSLKELCGLTDKND